MSKIRIAWTYQGQSYSAPVIMADMIYWEKLARDNRLPVVMTQDGFPQITYLAALAYSAGKRNRDVAPGQSFHDFCEGLEDLTAESADDPAEPDPFPNGPPDPGTGPQ